MYAELVAKVNSNATSGFVSKTKYDADKKKLEYKIIIAQNLKSEYLLQVNHLLVKKRDYNAKISEIEGKIPTISGLATNATLTAVENKIRNTNSFVRKTDYDTKITEIEKKFIDHDYDKSITTKYIIEAKAILKGWYAKLFSISTNVTIF